MIRATLIAAVVSVLLHPTSSFGQATPDNDAAPVIVALGGISSDMLFDPIRTSIPHTTPYLADHLDDAWAYEACFLRLSRCEIQAVFWDGDFSSVLDYTRTAARV